jgi:hypothetical protein
MNIIDAIKKLDVHAIGRSVLIYRKSWPDNILGVCNETEKNTFSGEYEWKLCLVTLHGSKLKGRHWKPTYEDLIADDWLQKDKSHTLQPYAGDKIVI